MSERCRYGHENGSGCWACVSIEKYRCAKILEGKRMLQEAYADPGRQREPKPRDSFAIALLWEAEREILGHDPKRYVSAEEEARDPRMAAFRRKLEQMEKEA